jgi:enoyl-CoA hydratase
MPGSYLHLEVTVDRAVATVMVNRPEARNALNRETVASLTAALQDLAADVSVGAIIFTGAGEKVFVSGADIRDIRERRRKDAFAATLSRLFAEIERFPKPTLAAINGYALGGGCELALACDLRIAASTARFGLPEASLGIIPGAGGTQRLPRIVGWGRAREMILTGDIIDATRALEIGLVYRVVAAEELLAAARETAEKVLARGPLAIRLAKMALNLSAQVPLEAGLTVEALAQAIAFESRDKEEGAQAFLEKRPPRFSGD